MFNTNNSAIKPTELIPLSDGSYIYNFNIKEEVVQKNNKQIVRYNYSSVKITGELTVSNVYNALLNGYYVDDETSLYEIINSPAKTTEEESIANDLYTQAQILLGIVEEPTELESAKSKMIKEIDNYDVSPDVNSFYLNGLQVWLDKSTRVGLMNSLTIEKNAGKEISTLWFGNIKLDINPDAAIQMLSSLELYALDCYNKTAEHKVNVSNLNSIEEISNYNYTEGYPEKLSFNV